MAESQSPKEVLAGMTTMFEADEEDLEEWLELAAAADGKLHANAAFGVDTSGWTLATIEDHVGEEAEVTPGDFGQGWLALPALGECPRCEDDQPQVAIGNPDDDILLVDCLGCETRYSLDAVPRNDLEDDGEFEEVAG